MYTISTAYKVNRHSQCTHDQMFTRSTVYIIHYLQGQQTQVSVHKIYTKIQGQHMQDPPTLSTIYKVNRHKVNVHKVHCI